MQATELRIGNYVKYSNGSKLFKVVGIHEFGIDVEDDIESTYIEYSEFEPIALTKEILLKCGFENTNIGYFEKRVMQRGKINIRFNKGVLEFLELGTSNHYLFGDMKKINLHQLQNLYFALTGQELEINL
jgi:hypothetical protein